MSLLDRRTLLAGAALSLAGCANTAAPTRPGPQPFALRMSDGVTLHGLQAGAGPDTLLLVPGFLSEAAIFALQIEAFAPQHHVLAVDPRGQGRSVAPAGTLGPERRVADYAELLRQAGRGRVVVVGWSMACAEALSLYALLGPERVRGLVLVDGFIGEDANPALLARTTGWMDWLEADPKGWLDLYLGQGMFRSRDPVLINRARSVAAAVPAPLAREIMLKHYVLDRRPLLRGLRVPLLYLRQPLPADGGPDPTWDAMQAAGVGRRVVVADAGHALFVDQPAVFNRELQGFISGLA